MKTSLLTISVLVSFALVMSLSAQAMAATCVGQTTIKSLGLSNTGSEDDTFSITSSNPDWVSVVGSVTVEAGQSVNVDVAVTPQLVGTNTYQLTIIGSKGVPQTITDSEEAMECRDVTIIGAPSEITACEGVDAVFDVIIKNGGQITDTYDVATSLGSLEEPRVTLEPDESRTMKLTVGTQDVEGEKEIFISAASGDVVDTHSMTLITKNCYSARLAIEPKEVVQCPSDSVSYQIYLKNTGELKDEYLLTIMDEVTQTFELESEESRFFNFSLPLEAGAGSMDIVVRAESDHVVLSESAKLTVKPAEECYPVEPDETIINIEQCSATTMPISISNGGSTTQIFRLDMEGPDWVYLNTERITLEPGEKRDIYLYISPLYETETDSYKVSVKSQSERSESEFDIIINVMPNASSYEPPAVAPGQPDAGGENVSLNVSLGDQGDDVSGAISLGAAPLWKTVVVAFITLIIVVILVVRFAILVKQ